MRKIAFVQGGGVGIDQEAALRKLLLAAGLAIDFEVHAAGGAAIEQGREALSPEMFNAIRACGIALKTKLLPPHAAPAIAPPNRKTPVNYNIDFRRQLGLFASVRPIHNLAGIPARFQGVNCLLVREITEDLYTASEHELVPGVVQSFKVVTEAACLRFFRFTFDLARSQGRKSVHCIHKANILKLADGLFLDCFRRVAAENADIAAKDLIVDNACMQLVSKPQQFEVLAAGNLYGDLLSDLGAGLIGGVSATSAINFGNGVKVYEAVYGASHAQVPPNAANPLPLIMPALAMLDDLGESAAAARIRGAVETVLTEGQIRTADLGGTATTEAFTQAIAAKL